MTKESLQPWEWIDLDVATEAHARESWEDINAFHRVLVKPVSSRCQPNGHAYWASKDPVSTFGGTCKQNTLLDGREVAYLTRAKVLSKNMLIGLSSSYFVSLVQSIVFALFCHPLLSLILGGSELLFLIDQNRPQYGSKNKLVLQKAHSNSVIVWEKRTIFEHFTSNGTTLWMLPPEDYGWFGIETEIEQLWEYEAI